MAIFEEFPGRIAVSSSFGAESAVLLHLVATVYRAVPILFLDTGKHFPETLEYRDRLIEHLELREVINIAPSEQGIAESDSDGLLHQSDQEACCDLRKVRPLAHALTGYDAWITGRKRYQSETREELPIFEQDRSGKIKVNPLANWSQVDVQTYADLHELPIHPLTEQNFPSVGCLPCTTPVAEGEDRRAGRWRGSEKTECGIHITSDGKIVRTNIGSE